jgi:hypothetical protein
MAAARGPLMDDAESKLPLRLPRSQTHAALLRAASLLKEKPPAVNRSFSPYGTGIHDSIKRPREEIQSSQETSPISSGRIRYPKLLKSASTSEVRARASKAQHRPVHYDSDSSSSSLQRRSPVTRSLRPSSSLALQGSSNVGIPPAPPPPPPSFRARISSSPALKKVSLEERHRNLLHKEILDSWDKVFFEGANTDVTVYTSDGHEFGAHSVVLVISLLSRPLCFYLKFRNLNSIFFKRNWTSDWTSLLCRCAVPLYLNVCCRSNLELQCGMLFSTYVASLSRQFGVSFVSCTPLGNMNTS